MLTKKKLLGNVRTVVVSVNLTLNVLYVDRLTMPKLASESCSIVLSEGDAYIEYFTLQVW